MSAVVIDFAAAAAAKRATKPATGSLQTSPSYSGVDLAHDFTFWNGASGIRYVHTVFGLLDCPEVPNANVVLVKRTPTGRAEALSISRVEHNAPSINLAEIRRTAAMLGATEVHVHLLAHTAEQRRAIELDLNSVEGLNGFGFAS